MIVRRETLHDIDVVHSLVVAAFRTDDGSEPAEAGLLDELRKCSGWIPVLSIVATIDDEIVGHAVCTRGHVGEASCVALGPIAVAPKLQRCGIGSALMHTMLGLAEGRDEPLVALLGSPDYYSRFGFVAAGSIGIEPPDAGWGEFFQVRTLAAHDRGMTGLFAYAEPFARR